MKKYEKKINLNATGIFFYMEKGKVKFKKKKKKNVTSVK